MIIVNYQAIIKPCERSYGNNDYWRGKDRQEGEIMPMIKNEIAIIILSNTQYNLRITITKTVITTNNDNDNYRLFL